MSTVQPQQADAPTQPGSWSPLAVRSFRAMWIATLFSNIGTWVHEVAAGWLMTDLSASRLLIALVQAATMGPVFLLGLPAGALADIVDRRRLLMVAQAWNFAAAAALAVLSYAGLVTPPVLLALVALLAMGTAMHMPAFQAIVPDLVPRTMLKPAVTLNGVSINLARAIGPALAGIIISVAGVWAAFAINALTFLAILLVVWRWDAPTRSARLPPEHVVRAVLVGIRYARHDRPLQVVLIRAGLFMSCASAGWALLPVVIRAELDRSAGEYGIALTCIGVGAVTGAFVLPRFGRNMRADTLVILATMLFAAGMVAMALIPSYWLLLPALFALGLAWLIMMATLNASAQTVLPDWVRARGLAVFLIVFSGSMAAGAAAWGLLADLTTTSIALVAAGSVAALGCVLNPFLPLASGDVRALSPSKHMPVHTDLLDVDDTGEVQVLVRYLVNPEDEVQFQSLMHDVRSWRLRTGAHSWHLYRDFDHQDQWVESFTLASWIEHLRQHARTTAQDWDFQEAVCQLHRGEGTPRVVHLISPRMDGSIPTRGATEAGSA